MKITQTMLIISVLSIIRLNGSHVTFPQASLKRVSRHTVVSVVITVVVFIKRWISHINGHNIGQM